MSKLHLTSGSGHCYPFDNRGDGYGRGEGCVVLTLKRLDDALRDRDPVRAVLVNTGVNQDGYTPASITYPNVSRPDVSSHFDYILSSFTYQTEHHRPIPHPPLNIPARKPKLSFDKSPEGY